MVVAVVAVVVVLACNTNTYGMARLHKRFIHRMRHPRLIVVFPMSIPALPRSPFLCFFLTGVLRLFR
ncbi:hypothetical protein CHLRE_15g643702v5 [Chlamydomonas reinhardtii]|uniref:Uncharacterized protein n=1 Tax=Chlamydomonas reinhardtii TaxID=3055 RepID=A0A2K3CX11_CHLRE|nr:uncharacterized protein CHLRE_15g643702v5 [Chlamydomonas reinhardtii]PNW72799.1 hypothetical protein CHLRE_15g643702v5 [Chlamydomonas reinhardtii]